MPITLGTNIPSLQAQRRLFEADQKLGTVFERLSSGQRINRASDDAAGLAISESLRTNGRVFSQAIRNLSDGQSVLNIADSAVEELSSIVTRIQELATQAGNGSLSNQQRESLDTEAQELRDEFFRVSREAEFNGLRLFDGSLENGLRLQGGYGVDGSILSSLGGEMGDGSFSFVTTVSGVGTVYDTATGDLNGDGFLDIVSSAYAGGELLVQLGNGDGTFSLAQSFVFVSDQSEVRLGDLNGDGVLDIVTQSYTGGDLITYVGNGDGTFGAATSIDLAGSGRDFELGDVNGDGILDAVTSDYSNGNVEVLLGDGSGSFSSFGTFALGATADQIALGDLNGDGLLDLVVTDYANQELVSYLGNGSGNFSASSTVSVGETITDLQLTDVDNDGDLDVLFVDNSSGLVSLSEGDGNGNITGSSTILSLDPMQSLNVGDLDGDGNIDLVATSSTDDLVYVAIGGGDGTFTLTQTFDGSDTRDVELGDFNNDGVLDFVAANAAASTLSIYSGDTREGINPLLEFSLRTQADALQAIAPLETKLNLLSQQRGVIGAFQSRLETAVNTLQATTENFSAAESRIRDADIAEEAANLARLNILRQAATSVLAQANQQPALSLALLSEE